MGTLVPQTNPVPLTTSLLLPSLPCQPARCRQLVYTTTQPLLETCIWLNLVTNPTVGVTGQAV
jgi:hypothetical protein